MSAPSSATKMKRPLVEQFDMFQRSSVPAPARPHVKAYPTTPPAEGYGVAALTEAIRSQAAELDLERKTREASVRELTFRTQSEMGELREAVRVLRAENTSMKETIWALERRKGVADAAAPSSYFSSAQTAAALHLPLIPRVGELESEIDLLKQALAKLRAEAGGAEQVRKAVAEMRVELSDVVEQCKDFARHECERRDGKLSALDDGQHEQGARLAESARHLSQLRADFERRCAALEGRVDAAEGAPRSVPRDRHTIDPEGLAGLQEEVSRVQSAVAELRAELGKTARRLESADLEVQEGLQAYVSQRIEVVKATVVPREELTRLQGAITSLTAEVDRASNASHSAKATAEDTAREATRRLNAAEQVIASLSTKAQSDADRAEEQQQLVKKALTEVSEARAGARTQQADRQTMLERLDAVGGRCTELEAMAEASQREGAALRQHVQAADSAITAERQGLRDRLASAEEQLKSVRAAVAASGETVTALQRSVEGMSGTARDDAVLRERHASQLQRAVTDIAAIQSRCGAVEDTVESSARRLREEVDALIKTRVEAASVAHAGRVRESTETLTARVESAVAQQAEDVKRLAAQIAAATSTARTAENAAREAASSDELRAAVGELTAAMSGLRKDLSREIDAASAAAHDAVDKADRGLELVASSRSRSTDPATSRMAVDELHARVDELAVVLERLDAGSRQAKDREKALAQATQEHRDGLDDLQAIVGELAQRTKDLAARGEDYISELQRHEELISANETNVTTVYEEMVAAAATANELLEVDGAAPQRLADVVRLLCALGSQAPDPSEATASSLLSLTRVVDRHEAGFARIPELTQAIQFNSGNIQRLAAAIGINGASFAVTASLESEEDPEDDVA